MPQATALFLQRNVVPVPGPRFRSTLQDRMLKAERTPLTENRSRFGELMEAIAEHRDRMAFARLFDHFAPRLKSYVRRLGADPAAAEDLVQDVMLTVWRRADQFDPSKADVATWIFTIARNRRIDLVRRERRPELDPNDPALVPERETGGDKFVERSEFETRLRQAIATLPEEQGQLLRLAYYDDKPHSAIADELDIPLGTVKSRIRLAMKKLKHRMAELE